MHFRINFFLFSVLVAVISSVCGRMFEVNEQMMRVKRDGHQGITGPVHTFVKTDKHANFKWGARHHVGHHYKG